MKTRLSVVILVSITIFAIWASYRESGGDFRLDVLDVGQGDATLIRTPENITVLVDGGPGDNILTSLPKSMGLLNRRLDLIILTHPDADHLEGLIPILRRFEVGAVLRTGATKSTANFSVFEDLIIQKQIRDEKIYLGDRIKLGETANFTVLWPPEGNLNQEKPNESSIVGQLESAGYKFLLTGDIGAQTEGQLVSLVKDEYLRSQVLKVPHHGSKYSSSANFLEVVSPKVATVSSGANNQYGHPTSETLARLAKVNAQVLRTDLMGTVKFNIKPEGLVVTPGH